MRKLVKAFTAATVLGVGASGCSHISDGYDPVDVHAHQTKELKQKINGIMQDKAGKEEGCWLYGHVLDTVDEMHFSGPVEMPHAQMAKAAVGNMLREAYFDIKSALNEEKAEDLESKLTTTPEAQDGKLPDVLTSVTYNGHTVTLPEPPENMKQYTDHCAYLERGIDGLSEISPNKDLLSFYEDAINGALQETRDPHTVFMGEEKIQLFRKHISGELGGVGTQIFENNGYIEIFRVYKDTPAEKMGLEDGDVILSVDGKLTKDMQVSQAVKLISGVVGQDVNLLIKRDGQEPFEVTLTRAVIKIPTVSAELVGENNDIGYIQIFAFGKKTSEEFWNGMEKINSQIKSEHKGKSIEKLIVDVRNNGGGLLMESARIANMLVDVTNIENPKKRRLLAQGKTADENVWYYEPPFNLNQFLSGGLVVLQNDRSASASEIVAGALQDSGVEIIGTTSFGKGTVQNMKPIFGGMQLLTDPSMLGQNHDYGAVKVTTEAFFPGQTGLSNQGSGIIPNTQVVYNNKVDQVRAESRREKDLDHSIVSTEKTRAGQTPQEICSLSERFAQVLLKDQIDTMRSYEWIKIYQTNEQGEKQAHYYRDADLACALKRLGEDRPEVTFAPNDNDNNHDNVKTAEKKWTAPMPKR